MVEYKILDYEYFMERLQPYEIATLSKMLPWSNKQLYEATRLTMWSALSPYMKQKKTPDKILPLYTDTHDLYEEHEEAMAEEDVDKIRQHILSIYRKK